MVRPGTSRRHRLKHMPMLAGTLLSYVLLVILNAQHFLPHLNALASPLQLLTGIRLGFSVLVSFLFLAVGMLVWLSARNRTLAWLLLCFCLAMMTSFAVQTAAKDNDPVLSAIGAASSALALLPFAVLLLLFPHNYLSSRSATTLNSEGRGEQSFAMVLVRGYIVLLILLSGVAGVYSLIYYLVSPSYLPSWLSMFLYGYYLLAILGIFITMLISYFRSSSLRERQQLHLFVGGVIIAFAPALILTILPQAMNLPQQFVIDGQVSTLTVPLLPLALGYSILRYQILMYDSSIRRTSARIVGGISLALLVYLVVILCNLLVHDMSAIFAFLWPAIAMALFAPGVWQGAQMLTERYFFSEIWHYRRLLARPEVLVHEPLNLVETCDLLLIGIIQALEPSANCLFLLEQASGRYTLVPTSSPTGSHDALSRRLMQQMPGGRQRMNSNWLDAHGEIISQLSKASRPLFLSEIHQAEEMAIPQFLLPKTPYGHNTTDLYNDLLLVPVWARGRLIGVLVLDERSDHVPYAGPDFEIVSLILARYSADLDNARMALDLRTAYERQKELDRLKDQFIVTASHELRTPLTAVQGYIELLAEFDQQLSPEDRATFLTTARYSCDELTLMVENLMNASHMEVDTKNIKLGPVALAETVQYVLEILDGVMRRENRSNRLDISPTLYILTDPMRLRQVLLNLLNNALKYSSPGTSLEITAEADEQEVTIRVRDFGFGVPPEEQENLFDRFVRLERDMNSPVRGTGLGLYICKQLIEAMGGRIWVESTGVEGEGSVFAFTLTRASSDMEHVDMEKDESSLITV